MRKHLIIAGIICSVTMPSAYAISVAPVGGTGVTKCVKLNTSTSCVSLSTNNNSSNWKATCKTGTTAVPVQGVAVCASTSAAQFSTQTELTVSNTDSQNKRCWCKMTSPAVSDWVTPGGSDGFTTALDCRYSCSTSCAGAIENSSGDKFIIAMFGTLSD